MNKELLTKFRNSPGTMTTDELNALKEFLTIFIGLFSEYSQFQDHEGVARNLIKSDIDKVEWYINFND